MSKVFISYKREDRPQARAIAEFLVANGHDVWWDIELLPGQRFADEIKAVLSKAKAVVILWSTGSAQSASVRSEATMALGAGTLVPVKLDDCDLPMPFGQVQTLYLQQWDGASSTSATLTEDDIEFVRRVYP